jgi:hypothetical protein
MPEPQVITLSDLASFKREFTQPQKIQFTLPDLPGKTFEVTIKPLSEADLSEYSAFDAQLVPPMKAAKQAMNGDGSPALEQPDPQPDWSDPEFRKTVPKITRLRRAFVLSKALQDIEIEGETLQEKADALAGMFPAPLLVGIETEIMKRSTNEIAIINRASFSSGAGSAQS